MSATSTSPGCVQLLVGAVARPFDVHGAAVMLLDEQRLPRQLLHLRVAERESRPLGAGHFHRAHALGGPCVRIDHLDGFGPKTAAQYRGAPGAQPGLVDVELVRVHRALHDGLPQAVGAGDEHHLAETRVGIEREHHAARAQIAPYHVLHAHRQRDLRMLEALVHAIGDGAIVVQRGVHLVYRAQQRRLALYVEEGLLLSGEGGGGQVLGGGRGAHGHGDVPAGRHGAPAVQDSLAQRGRKRCIEYPAPDARAAGTECRDVRAVEHVELGLDAPVEAALVQELAEGIGRGRKAARHAHAERRQRAQEFADGGVLAAHTLEIPEADRVEGQDVFAQRVLPLYFERRIVHDFIAWDTARRDGRAEAGGGAG